MFWKTNTFRKCICLGVIASKQVMCWEKKKEKSFSLMKSLITQFGGFLCQCVAYYFKV